jgi:hypothetical protein
LKKKNEELFEGKKNEELFLLRRETARYLFEEKNVKNETWEPFSECLV